MTTFETTTSLAPEAVLAQAKSFFATRVPATAAFVEKESPCHLVLRGQGGEEVVLAVVPGPAGGTVVRGSSLFFGPQVKRFFTTLPPALEGAA